jgi:hypothetical protein
MSKFYYNLLVRISAVDPDPVGWAPIDFSTKNKDKLQFL